MPISRSDFEVLSLISSHGRSPAECTAKPTQESLVPNEPVRSCRGSIQQLHIIFVERLVFIMSAKGCSHPKNAVFSQLDVQHIVYDRCPRFWINPNDLFS